MAGLNQAETTALFGILNLGGRENKTFRAVVKDFLEVFPQADHFRALCTLVLLLQVSSPV